MDATIKEFFDEIIAHRQKTATTLKYLSEAENEMGRSKLSQLNALMLSWMHGYAIGDPSDIYFKIGDHLYGEYSPYFDRCDTIRTIFTLHKDRLDWNSALSEESRKEIAKYVRENFKIKLYANTDGKRREIEKYVRENFRMFDL